MNLRSLTAVSLSSVDWASYDLVILGCGFEARSTFMLQFIPDAALGRCLVLGFPFDRQKLSRESNDAEYAARGLVPLIASSALDYETAIRTALLKAVSQNRSARIFVDYSVMTRSWYAYVLTWLKYSADVESAQVDFAYAQGAYEGEFEPLRIEEITAISGFEGVCAGARRTVAFYGLGYDKYATLAVHELIEPDSVICYVAREAEDDPRSRHVLEQNQEIIEMSGAEPVYVPLGDLDEAFRILHERFTDIGTDDEILAIPMGPKTHVLATLLVAQVVPHVTCLHARGMREHPVQVRPTGDVSLWRAAYGKDPQAVALHSS